MQNNDNTAAQSAWIRLELLTQRPEIDAAQLASLGAAGIETQDGETFMDDAPFAPVPDGWSRLIAFFEDTQEVAKKTGNGAAALHKKIEKSLPDIQIISVAIFTDRSWETAWMKYFKPITISPRVSVGPPWDPPVATDNTLALTINPGMAFGTGTHETTQLCAYHLDEILLTRPVETLLDVGCGSAILSMLATGLGATHVTGIDIDATSIEVATENVEINGFSSDEIELSTRPIHDIDAVFDVVVANILAHILIDLRDELLRTTAPGGDLLLSGIPNESLDEVRTHFTHPDFSEVASNRDGEWAALHLRRKSVE